jgi:RimJ/RimL family protein N-acetyltransferase
LDTVMTTLVTDRLTLRPPQEADAEALVRGLGNLNVSRWTGRVPHPYGHADAAEYIARHRNAPQDELMLFITHGGELIGGIGITQDELGYWLAEPHWGRGFGTEAAQAVTGHAFTAMAFDSLVASYQLGNAASRRILLGLGFQETGEDVAFSRARAAEVPIMRMALTRQGWAKAKERKP